MKGRAVIVLAIGWLAAGAHPLQADAAEESRPAHTALPSLSQLVIPSDLGQVSQLLEVPAPSPSAKRLILIEDAHVNYEGQKHLAAILDRLASAYGVTLIMVEGGEGDVGLASLRAFGSTATRKAVAERHLRDGTLSGEEYVDMVSEQPLSLWGVEDMALYDQQYAAFLAVERAREQAGDSLARLRAAVDQIRAQSPNEPLRAFESKQAAFAAGTLKFSAYADDLSAETQRLGLSLDAFPHLQPLMEATRLEPDLDQDQVNRQQREAVERARLTSSDQAWAGLKGAADRLKAGTGSSADYYEALEALLRDAHVDVAGFPALARSLHYASLRAQSNGRAWWMELARLERDLRARLIGSPEERQLAALADRVVSGERLLRLEWTAEDRAEAQRQPEILRVSSWLPALRARAGQAGVAAPSVDAAALDQALSEAARFYDITERRDEVIVRRALEQMDQAGRQTAVLIAGGFHTGSLIERLAGQGVQVAVVTPWAGADDDPSRYASILKAKYEEYRQRRTQMTADRNAADDRR